jgi:hypothetical protein
MNEGYPTVKFARRVKSVSAFLPDRACGRQKRWHDVSCFFSGLHVCVKICVLFSVTQFAFSSASRPTQFTYDFNVPFFILG